MTMNPQKTTLKTGNIVEYTIELEIPMEQDPLIHTIQYSRRETKLFGDVLLKERRIHTRNGRAILNSGGSDRIPASDLEQKMNYFGIDKANATDEQVQQAIYSIQLDKSIDSLRWCTKNGRLSRVKERGMEGKVYAQLVGKPTVMIDELLTEAYREGFFPYLQEMIKEAKREGENSYFSHER